MREVQAQLGLIEQLRGEPQACVSVYCIQVGHADVARHAVLEVFEVTRGGLGAQLRLGLTGMEELSVEDRNVDVDSSRAVAIAQGGLAGGNVTDAREGTDGGAAEVALGLREALSCALLGAQARQFGALAGGGGGQVVRIFRQVGGKGPLGKLAVFGPV